MSIQQISPSLGTIIKDIMTFPVITTTADTTLDIVIRKMIMDNIMRLPVTDNQQNVIGIISDRDLRLAAGSPIHQTSEEIIKNLQKSKVEDIMTRSVITADETAPIVDAAKLLRVAKVGGLPVLNLDGKLVGIITRTDLLDHLIRILEPIPHD